MSSADYTVSIIKKEPTIGRLCRCAVKLVSENTQEKKLLDELSEIVKPDGENIDPEVRRLIRSLDGNEVTMDELGDQISKWLSDEVTMSIAVDGLSDTSTKLLPVAKSVLASLPRLTGENLAAGAAMAIGLYVYAFMREHGLKFKVERTIT